MLQINPYPKNRIVFEHACAQRLVLGIKFEESKQGKPFK